MKQVELRKKCGNCGEGVLNNNADVFFRVKVERFIIDMGAVHRQAGLEQMMGSPMLAGIMRPDEDMAEEIGSEEALICMSCACGYSIGDIESKLAEKSGNEDSH